MTQAPSRFSRRSLLCVGTLGVSAALLAACGGGGASPTTAPAPAATSGTSASAPTAAPTTATKSDTTAAPKPTAAAAAAQPAASGTVTKLVFWRHQYDPTDKAYREIIFPAARDKLNLEFDFQVQRHDDYTKTMLPQLASGGGPDLFEVTEAFRIKFAKAGVFAPVNYGPWGGKEGWEKFWQQGVVEALRIDGKDFNVPLEWGAIPSNLFVHEKHAQEAGIAGDIPKYQQTPISWAELGPWAAKMTKKDANGQIVRDGYMIQHGYGPDRTFAFWEPYFLQAGGQIVSEDGKQSLLNTEPGIAAMQNLHGYVFEHQASMLRPQDKESGSAKVPKEETSSTSAMSQWAYGTFRQLAPDTWQSIRSLLAPQVDPAKPLYESGPGWSSGVHASSKQQEAAFKFMHFAVAEHGSTLFDGGVVAPVVGWTEKYPGVGKLPDASVWKKMSEEAVPRVRTEPELLTGVQRAEGFQRAFEAIMFNKADIKAELDRWNQEVQEALSSL